MDRRLLTGLATAALLASTGSASAEGELNIFNWGNYTSPELIEKFAQAYDVEVTVTDYDSNDTALAKVKAGGTAAAIGGATAFIDRLGRGEGAPTFRARTLTHLLPDLERWWSA